MSPRSATLNCPSPLLAQVAADREQTMGVHTWRNRNADAARWLGYLASTSYELSDIELHVVNKANIESGVDASDADEAA